VPNRVIVKLGPDGKVNFFNGSGSTDLVVDVGGWFTSSGPVSGGQVYTPVAPARILDTRTANGGHAWPLGPGETFPLAVAGRGGAPPAGATAVVLNVTVTGPTVGGYLTVWPGGPTSPPLASDLNFVANQTVPNLVVVKLGADGTVNIFNGYGSTHVVVDIEGWYG